MISLTMARKDSLESALVPWKLEGIHGTGNRSRRTSWPFAKEIAETVLNVKINYRRKRQDTTKPLNDLPSRPGKVIGSLRRVDIYEER